MQVIFALICGLFVLFILVSAINYRPQRCPGCGRLILRIRHRSSSYISIFDEFGDPIEIVTPTQCPHCQCNFAVVWNDFEGQRVVKHDSMPPAAEKTCISSQK